MTQATRRQARTRAAERGPPRRPAHPGAPLRRARQGRLRARSRCAKGEVVIEYKGEVIDWPEALRRHPHDPKDPNHTFYFHIDDEHVIDAKYGGNAARWINHACQPNCEADEIDGRVFIKALRAIKPGEELFYDYGLIIDETLHAEAEEAVRMPLRHAQVPRHDAGAQALTAQPMASRAPLALGSRGAVAAARAAAAGPERRGGRALRRRPTPRCSSAPASSCAPEAGQRARCWCSRSVESAAFGRRAADVQPCLLVAEHQTGGRGRLGRGWQSAPGASLTFSLALPLERCRLVGPVAGGRRGAGRGARPGARAAAPRMGLKWPNDLWLLDAPAAPRPQARRRADRDRGGRRQAAGRDRRRPERAADAEPPRSAPASPACRRSTRSVERACRAAPAGAAAGAGAAPLRARRLRRLRRPPMRARDLLRGQPVRTTQQGLAEGVAAGRRRAAARCWCDTPAGLRAVTSGEVSVRLGADGGAAVGMLQRLVVLLLLANLLFFAWSQGWLDEIAGSRVHPEREPERLARQVQPGAGGDPAARCGAASAPGRRCGVGGGVCRGGEQRLRRWHLPRGRALRHRRRRVGRGGAGRPCSRAAAGQLGRGEDRAARQLDGLHGPLPEPRRAGEEGRGAQAHPRELRVADGAGRAGARLLVRPLRRSRRRRPRRWNSSASAACAARGSSNCRRRRPSTCCAPRRPTRPLAAQLAALRSPALGRGFVPCGS